MLSAPVFLLLISIVLQHVPVSRTEDTALFYITPTNSPNSDCPHRSQSWNTENSPHCITLDNFTRYELPDVIENHATIKKLTLIFLEGTHYSTTPMNISGLQHVTMVNLNPNSQSGNEKAVEHLPLIQLQSGYLNVSIRDAKTPSLLRSSLEIRGLKINGSGNSTLTIKTSQSVNISVSNVEMMDTVFQIDIDGTVCPFVTISDTIFVASMIEIYGCGQSYRDRNITIFSSTFRVSEKQPYAVAVCPSMYYYSSTVGDDLAKPKYENIAIQIRNVSALDLSDNSFSLLLPNTICYSLLSTNYDPADIVIMNKNSLDVTITNSTFNRSYGTAIRSSKTCHNCGYSLFTIKDSHFMGYTKGVFVFSGNLIHGVIRLINTTVTRNSVSTPNAMQAVALAITPTVYLTDPMIIEITNCVFQDNVDYVGNLQIILLLDVTDIIISNTTFMDNTGTVINAKESNVTFVGNILFENNHAWQGGALSLFSSTMTLQQHTIVEFINNHASQSGGAIFIDDSSFYLQNYEGAHQFCFYQPSYPDYYFTDAKVTFFNNSATKGGDYIYGTSIRNYCRIHFQQDSNSGNYIWKRLFDIEWTSTLLSPITSKAMRICLCDSNGQPQCDDTSKIFSVHNSTIYPGESFPLSLAVVGAEFGTTTGEVYAKLLPSHTQSALSISLEGNFVFISDPKCVTINCLIKSTNSFETVYLTTTDILLRYYGDMNGIKTSIEDFNHTEVIPNSLLTTPVFINVTLSNKCPVGFTMIDNYCACYHELSERNVTCKFLHGKGLLSRYGSIWVGRNTHNFTTYGFIFNHLCPSDNCKLDLVSISLDVDNGSEADLQCAFNHSGLLCGGCREGYSVAIGSSHCLNCTNNSNLALLLFFAAAGPLLYMFIAALDLTITRGTINGVIFYANIVWLYQGIVFSDNSINTSQSRTALYVFKIFIAWLNLDFGIETCFIKGLDAFWKSILQYLFPLYLWVIAWLVKVAYSRISVEHFRDRYPRLVSITGKPVNVLTTFIFLSYTKFLRSIASAFAFATLSYYPHKKTQVVWAIDGNVPYFSSKHAVVFILAVLFLIFTLFYTIYVFFAGLQSCSLINLFHCTKDGNVDTEPGRLCRWCKNLFDMPLPLRDSHFLPLKSGHRYWFGLLLLVRIILLVIHSLTYLYPQPNLLILMITSTVILCYMGWKNVYKNDSVWILHGVSLSNLIFLSGASFTDIQRPIIVCISVSITLVQFVAVVTYHSIQCCFKNKNDHKSSNESYLQSSYSVPSDDDSRRINSRESEDRLETRGFRESLLSLTDESEPLIGKRSQTKTRNIFHCLPGCCREKSNSDNDLSLPTSSYL